MLLKMSYCVKDENPQTVAVVKMCVIVVTKILGDSVCDTKNVILQHHFFGYVFVDLSFKWI